jgi:hypothetical protein
MAPEALLSMQLIWCNVNMQRFGLMFHVLA